MNKIKEDSIVSFRKGNMIVLSIVKRVAGDALFCDQSIISQDLGVNFVPTREFVNSYTGEHRHKTNLIDAEEFDMIMDADIIDKRCIKNVNQLY